MRIKKALATFVAGTFLFGSMATANAAQYSDIAGKDSANAIQKLTALKIINGYEDGTFKPDAEITRAEFAKIAVTAAGLADSADLLKDTASQYSDVKGGVWYTGWINIASAQGYLKGYPNGTFQPNANISYSEAITILMRILGYDDRLPGNWPVDYISKAAAEDVTKDVTFAASAKATRGSVAMLTSNSLDADMVEYDNEYALKFAKTGATLLEDAFEGTTVEDVIVADWDLNDGVFSLDVAGGSANDREFAKEFSIAGAGAVPALTDRVVDYIYDDEEDEVLFVEVKDYGFYVGDEITVSDDKVEMDGKSFKVANSYSVIENLTAETEASIKTDIAGATDVDIEAEYIKVVLDEDGKVVRLVVKDLAAPAIVEENDGGNLSFKTGEADVDLSDDDKEYFIVKDGQPASIEDIKEDDLVAIDESKTADYYLEVFSKTVKGEVESVKSDLSSIKIGGTSYDLDVDAQLSLDGGEDVDDLDPNNYDDFYGEEVTAYINKAGDIQYIIANGENSENDMYGVVVKEPWDVTDSSGTTKTYVKVLKGDGTEVSYAIDDDEVTDATINALANGDFVKFNVTGSNEIDEITEGANLPADEFDSVTLDDVDGNKLLLSPTGQEIVASDVKVFTTVPTDADDVAEILSLDELDDTIVAAGGTLAADIVMKDDRVEYIVINRAVEAKEDVVVFVDADSDKDGDYVIFNINGEEVKKYVAANVYADDSRTAGDTISIYSGLKENDVVSFATTGDDVDVIDVLVPEATKSALKVVDYDTESILIENTAVDPTTKAWKALDDEDLVMVDIRGDEPVFITDVAQLKGKYVVVDTAAEATWVVVVDKQ